MSNDTLNAQDYDAIEAAVMETERGRWFLREYATRNRTADTRLIVTMLERLEARFAPPAPPEPVTQSSLPDIFDLPAMEALPAGPALRPGQIAQWIEAAKAEMSHLREEAAHNGRILRQGNEFDAISAAFDHAINSVLNAAEHIQEMSWVLRTHGMDTKACNELDQRANEIYLACSFQDIVARRLSTLVDTLVHIDAHIAHAGSAAAGEPGPMAAVPSIPPIPPQAPSEKPVEAKAAPPAPAATVMKAEADRPKERKAEIKERAVPPSPQPVKDKAPPVPVQKPAPVANPNSGADTVAPRKSNTAGNLALASDEDLFEKPAPARKDGIDYAELSFSEKVALFS